MDFLHTDFSSFSSAAMMLSDKKPITLAEEERKRMEEEKEQMVPETGTCECADRETDQSLREKEASSAIDFEDALHNQVYVKRKPRRKRDVSDILFRKTKSLDQVIRIDIFPFFPFFFLFFSHYFPRTKEKNRRKKKTVLS